MTQSRPTGDELYGHQAYRNSGLPVLGDQIKLLCIEQDRTMHDLLAEAFNDLFTKYGKPEIAPRKDA